MSRICRIIVLFGDKSAWDCREPVNFLLTFRVHRKLAGRQIMTKKLLPTDSTVTLYFLFRPRLTGKEYQPLLISFNPPNSSGEKLK